MKPIKIKITNEDIKKGIRSSEDSCPVALACRRELNLAKWATQIGENYISLAYYNYYMPRKVKKFINKFDKKEFVRPFTMELRKKYD